MSKIHHALRIARRYADGGSDDSETPTPSGLSLGPQPSMHVGHLLQMQPLSPDNPTETHSQLHAPYMPGALRQPAPTEEPAPISSVAKEHAQAIADQLIEKHGPDDHAAISESMMSMNPSERADAAILSKLPPSVRNGVIDHRLQEANRLLNPQPSMGGAAELGDHYIHETMTGEWQIRRDADNSVVASGGTQEAALNNFRANQPPPRQPGASRTGYVSPYGIYGQHSEPSEEDYHEQLSPFEGETYPGVAREQHPFYSLSQDALSAYQKYISPKLGNIRDFAQKFFGGYETRGLNVESAEHPEYGEGSLSFDGHLTDNGNHVADISVSINPSTNSAHLGLLEISPQYRGEAGPKLLRNQIDMYKQMGLDYVDLYAAGGGDPYGGSYAWAKYGFVPNQQDWDLMRMRFAQRIDDPRYRRYLKPADREQESILTNILNTKGPRAIWPLSDFKAPNVNGDPIGKMMLLGHGWSGQLIFRDPGAMRRFDAYIARPKKPKPTE